MHLLFVVAAETLGGATACEVTPYWHAIRREPLSRDLVLELATDRTEYVIGEAVEFEVTLRNVSEARVEGAVASVMAPSSVVRIDYRRGDGTRRALDSGTINPELIARTRGSIEPEGFVTARNLRAFDGGRDAFMLDAPGLYTFTATFCEPGQDRNGVVVSNSVAVDVRPVPAGQREAWEAFTTELATWGESVPNMPDPPAAVTERAYEFVERFPDSPWAVTLRRRLLRLGPSPVYTQAERERYERLRQAARERGEKRVDGKEP